VSSPSSTSRPSCGRRSTGTSRTTSSWGACNPHLASQALDVDRRIGLLLPCNVVVRDGGNGRTVVEVLDPHVMVAVPERDELTPVADEAARLLSAALSALSAGNPAATAG